MCRRKSAYSSVATGSWIEQGPAMTASRSSVPLRICVTARRPARGVVADAAESGSTLATASGVTTSSAPAIRVFTRSDTSTGSPSTWPSCSRTSGSSWARVASISRFTRPCTSSSRSAMRLDSSSTDSAGMSLGSGGTAPSYADEGRTLRNAVRRPAAPSPSVGGVEQSDRAVAEVGHEQTPSVRGDGHAGRAVAGRDPSRDDARLRVDDGDGAVVDVGGVEAAAVRSPGDILGACSYVRRGQDDLVTGRVDDRGVAADVVDHREAGPVRRELQAVRSLPHGDGPGDAVVPEVQAGHHVGE